MTEAERIATELLMPMVDFEQPTQLEAEAAALLRKLQAENEGFKRDDEALRAMVETERNTSIRLEAENEALRVDGDIIINRLSAENNRLHIELEAAMADTGHEKWAAVDEYVGVYEVSNVGRVRSITRIDSDGNRRVGKIMHPSLIPKGYLKVSLWRANKREERYVHRMVASTFCASDVNCPEVNHKDGDTKNNHFSNLEWVTTRENGIHRARVLKTGHIRAVVGVCIEDKSVVHFESIAQAKESGFTPSLIDKCIKGIRTHHKGYVWNYALKGATNADR